MAVHYAVNGAIKSLDDLKAIFPNGVADRCNWCFLSTSGVHGTYLSLDDMEEDGFDTPITVLVVHPRMCSLNYGNVAIGPGDVAWLRRLVDSTLDAVVESQEGNVPEADEGPSP